VVGIIKTFNPNAFYSVEDVRFVSGSYFKKNDLLETQGVSKYEKIYFKQKIVIFN
jgi:hypothetical protein